MRYSLYASGLVVSRCSIAFFFSREQLEFQGCHDRFRDLVLHRENVVKIQVVALGPNMAATRPVHELGGYAHPVPRLAYAALEHITRLELPGHLQFVHILAFEREGRVPGGDPERRDLAEIGNDILGNAVGEALLLRIAAHVCKR